MIKVGIDTAAFYTPSYYLSLSTLAQARGVNPNKYNIGLGQFEMAMCPPDEGIITMAANAAYQCIQDTHIEDIDLLLFATESSIDQSKAAGVFTHKLLNLSPHCRVIELKQACYAATAGLQLAISYIHQNPTKKVLLIASDIARYGLNTSGESSQGAGAIAMIISASPRLLHIEPGSGYHTEDCMDFWRPNYRQEALVDGKFSCEMYLKLLKETWQKYHKKTQRDFLSHDFFCYHIPLPRWAETAHAKLCMINGLHKPTTREIISKIGNSLTYSRKIGNCYTASLYIGLLSLLDNTSTDFTSKRIGFYSYGSGAVAEYFSGIIQPNYQNVLHTTYHKKLMEQRVELSQNEYEQFYTFSYPSDGSSSILPNYTSGRFRLAEYNNHQRKYTKTHHEKP